MKIISLKRNTIANYIGQGYTIIIGIVILPFYLEYLGAEQYGLVGFFTLLMSWMALLDMGLSATLQREIARLRDKNNGLYNLKITIVSVEFIYMLVSIIIFLLIFYKSDWIALNWLSLEILSLNTVVFSIKIMAFLLVLRWFVGLYYGIILGFEDQVWLNKNKIVFSTLKFIGAFIIIKYITHDIIYFFIFQFFIGLLEFINIKLRINGFFKRVNQKVLPSLKKLQDIAPFALALAYTSGLWIFITGIDKLMLSHYLTLKEYGYFTLVIVVANATLQLFQPIGQAILPRMTSLLSNGKKDEMVDLYHKSTQFVAIITLSTSGIIAMFAYELLYSWSGNIEASQWAAPILSWYVLGNGALSLLSFQYYMQYAYGNLKYHVKGNTYFGFMQILVMIGAVYFYGALGAGIAWFGLQIVFLSFWPGYIHNKFVPGIHKEWIFKDILPVLFTSIIYLYVVKLIDVNFDNFSRIEIFLTLMLYGIGMLIANSISSHVGRSYLFKLMKLGIRK